MADAEYELSHDSPIREGLLYWLWYVVPVEMLICVPSHSYSKCIERSRDIFEVLVEMESKQTRSQLVLPHLKLFAVLSKMHYIRLTEKTDAYIYIYIYIHS